MSGGGSSGAYEIQVAETWGLLYTVCARETKGLVVVGGQWLVAGPSGWWIVKKGPEEDGFGSGQGRSELAAGPGRRRAELRRSGGVAATTASSEEAFDDAFDA